MATRRVWRSRPQPGVADLPGADDDPYVLYLRWVEAGRPSSDDAERDARDENGSKRDIRRHGTSYTSRDSSAAMRLTSRKIKPSFASRIVQQHQGE